MGATVTAFVTNPATALALATIKTATGSNQPVLGMDATAATARQILGRPAVRLPGGGREHAVGARPDQGVAGAAFGHHRRGRPERVLHL